MNSTLRTRFVVLAGSAALVGALGGAAAASAGQAAAPPTSGVEPGCTAVQADAPSTVQTGAREMWFGLTKNAAR